MSFRSFYINSHLHALMESRVLRDMWSGAHVYAFVGGSGGGGGIHKAYSINVRLSLFSLFMFKHIVISISVERLNKIRFIFIYVITRYCTHMT